MKKPVDLGQVSFLQREIDQTNELVKELSNEIDDLVLKLTHGTQLTYRDRRKIMHDIALKKARRIYHLNKADALENKIQRYKL